ncbi:MAG: cysteine--tRNA ligase [Candidatus Omnitrophota bacterium]
MKIYNSLTRKKDAFVPIEKGKVGMYVCGPTVYDEPHIGHARSAYIFDCVRRYLKYKGFAVTFVRNVTDVDDKIINKAKTLIEGLKTPADLNDKTREVSQKYLDAYHADMELIGIGTPDREPKATEYIMKMQEFIKVLIDRGRAYASGGDVYFDIKKAKGYGKLSNQSIDKMETGTRIAPGELKRDPLDFALWKAAKEGEPRWDSPWGPGRPGWHIECSVMSSDILGDEFDIHGGGIDLIFPHHENEVAQSEGAGKKFARYWIHNGLLTINSEKMAKSLGNFITIKDFMERHKDPDYMKLFFLSAHYRSPIDYTEEKILEAKKEKERFLILFTKIDKMLGSGRPVINSGKKATDKDVVRFRVKFEEAMDDDFNTPLALAVLFEAVTFANKLMHEKERLSGSEAEKVYGIKELLVALCDVFALNISQEVAAGNIDSNRIIKMIDMRNLARKDKDFRKADEIRKELSGMGVILEDTKDGTEWRLKV